MKFNEKLITLRKKHGYTQEQLAEQLGVSRQAVSRWELGETTPEMNLLIQLCKVFNVSADYLINDEYLTDNDIPVVKASKRKYAHLHLVSSIAFIIANMCSIIGIFESRNDTQRYIAIILTMLMSFNAAMQMVLYFKRR